MKKVIKTTKNILKSDCKYWNGKICTITNAPDIVDRFWDNERIPSQCYHYKAKK